MATPEHGSRPLASRAAMSGVSRKSVAEERWSSGRGAEPSRPHLVEQRDLGAVRPYGGAGCSAQPRRFTAPVRPHDAP